MLWCVGLMVLAFVSWELFSLSFNLLFYFWNASTKWKPDVSARPNSLKFMRAIPHARATFIKAGDESSTEEEKDDDGDAPKKKKRVRGWMLMPWIVRHRSGIFFYSIVFFYLLSFFSSSFSSNLFESCELYEITPENKRTLPHRRRNVCGCSACRSSWKSWSDKSLKQLRRTRKKKR